MPKVDDKEYPYTKEGMEEAKSDAKKSGKKVKYHNPGPDKDDVRRAAEGLLSRLPEIVGSEKIAGLSVSLMFGKPDHGKGVKKGTARRVKPTEVK
jgi:hypothetical protein